MRAPGAKGRMNFWMVSPSTFASPGWVAEPGVAVAIEEEAGDSQDAEQDLETNAVDHGSLGLELSSEPDRDGASWRGLAARPGARRADLARCLRGVVVVGGVRWLVSPIWLRKVPYGENE